MIEAIVISFIVGFAALHVVFRLSPTPAQRKVRDVMAAGLNKIGLDLMAQRLVASPQVADKACGSGCDGCGIHATTDDEMKVKDSAKVMQFHQRLR
jgi:NO-binding membrane sensor protein with MHYT domain